jgi:hypothetical protein
MSLSSYEVRTSIAVPDLARAAEFYEGKLRLAAGEEQSDESRVYACGGGTSLHVYESPRQASQGTATLATWVRARPRGRGRRAGVERRGVRALRRSHPEGRREGHP